MKAVRADRAALRSAAYDLPRLDLNCLQAVQRRFESLIA